MDIRVVRIKPGMGIAASMSLVTQLNCGHSCCSVDSLHFVRETRSAAELKKFVSKLRVYTISDQDNSGPWIREQFPDLFYVASPGFHPGGAYHHATWSGISGDYFHARAQVRISVWSRTSGSTRTSAKKVR